MFEKIKNMNSKLKIAKDLIMNANKLIPLIRDKAEDLFKYQKTVSVNEKKVSLTLNGKLECVDLVIDKDFLKNNPEHAIECIKAAINASNKNMIEYVISEAKKVSEDIDPELLDKISSEFDEEIENSKSSK